MTDIRCPKCGKMLGRDMGDRIEVKGRPSMTLYQAAVVVITCHRCGQKSDVPVTRTSG